MAKACWRCATGPPQQRRRVAASAHAGPHVMPGFAPRHQRLGLRRQRRREGCCYREGGADCPRRSGNRQQANLRARQTRHQLLEPICSQLMIGVRVAGIPGARDHCLDHPGTPLSYFATPKSTPAHLTLRGELAAFLHLAELSRSGRFRWTHPVEYCDCWLRGPAATYTELNFLPFHGGNTNSHVLRDAAHYASLRRNLLLPPLPLQPLPHRLEHHVHRTLGSASE